MVGPSLPSSVGPSGPDTPHPVVGPSLPPSVGPSGPDTPPPSPHVRLHPRVGVPKTFHQDRDSGFSYTEALRTRGDELQWVTVVLSRPLDPLPRYPSVRPTFTDQSTLLRPPCWSSSPTHGAQAGWVQPGQTSDPSLPFCRGTLDNTPGTVPGSELVVVPKNTGVPKRLWSETTRRSVGVGPGSVRGGKGSEEVPRGVHGEGPAVVPLVHPGFTSSKSPLRDGPRPGTPPRVSKFTFVFRLPSTEAR